MDRKMRKAIICDIDGTLAHMHDRSPYDWDKVGDDDVDSTIKNILRVFYSDGSYAIIIVSGRDEVCKHKTIDWLRKNYVMYDELFMRPRGDNRPDEVIKKEIYDRHIKNEYRVAFVLDDRNKVVKMWRKLGLKCLQVEEGNF